MIIALAIPAYKQTVHIQTAYAWTQDAISAIEMGWRPLLLWVDANNIEASRNTIVHQAEQAGARLLLMCDADNWPVPLEGGLKNMWRVMSEHGAAVVGAAIAVRNGAGMNCQPSLPGSAYPGVVGTGYELIDIVKLRNLPKPWFRCEMSADGMSKALGSDVAFCQRVAEAGHKVIVNYTLPTAHAEQGAVATRLD